jgi:hypothetical protein
VQFAEAVVRLESLKVQASALADEIKVDLIAMGIDPSDKPWRQPH